MDTEVTRKTVVRVLAALLMLAIGTGQADERAKKSWECSSDGHERVLELYEPDGERGESALSCWVVYTKDDASEVLWQARNDADYCEPKALALIAKLESAGFACTASYRENRPDSSPGNAPTTTDDTDVMMPPEPVGGGSESANAKADLRMLLSRHYEESYLDAMLAALPGDFSLQPDTGTISPGPGRYLHVGPPDHFVKTLSDGSYVLVNTLLYAQATTSSYVNLGFQVRNKRYRFLGYATTGPVTDFEVLDADIESVVISVMPVPAADCDPGRRTQVLAWHGEISGQNPQGANTIISGDDGCGQSAP